MLVFMPSSDKYYYISVNCIELMLSSYLCVFGGGEVCLGRKKRRGKKNRAQSMEIKISQIYLSETMKCEYIQGCK